MIKTMHYFVFEPFFHIILPIAHSKQKFWATESRLSLAAVSARSAPAGTFTKGASEGGSAKR